ncbi:hypothetical protein K470DRAFT_65863 [Piedraia hortae CBS 480.64]|uniref:DNA recombination and repair protein Rad51-like C-terminal domain-containing protein n=1 Tax=Piedraia hortae CBS 480.64 TaxID=1314780 RepID=A0A6A7C076_9PEZI|nr:hypothetical protein K470DRAFT_65863 [Piedraia hortae CBS 480.64]
MAKPASPKLASTIYETLSTTPSYRFPFRQADLDVALQGGLVSRSMICISSELGITSSLLLLLLSNSLREGRATVVDTGSPSVDLIKLHSTLASELGSTKAMEALDKARIIRSFDFIGVEQSLEEISMQAEELEPAVDDSQEEEMLLDPVIPQVPDLLILTNLSHVAAPLIRDKGAEGRTRLNAFMRSLCQLTLKQNLCTVVGNEAMSHNREGLSSIFTSCTLHPALGNFTDHFDVNILVHTVPSAESANGDVILEVLTDRHGGRAGKWATIPEDI